MSSLALPETTQLSLLLEKHSALFLDAYGVLIDHEGVLPGARELIEALNRKSYNYFVVTNDASRLPETQEARFHGRGLPIPKDRIVSSGDLIAPYFAEERLQGSRCIVLGGEDAVRYVQRAGAEVVPYREDADVVLIADDEGFPFLPALGEVISMLFRRIEAGRPPRLVLPNPDLIYPQGPGKVAVASGSLGALVEGALRLRFPGAERLTFRRLGKPYAPIFEEACRRAGTRDAVMVGDQLETDIRGGRDFGLATALITTGLTPAAEASRGEVRPSYLLHGLC
jgi:HAD superfamily hydrolase (TIGR01450 family)